MNIPQLRFDGFGGEWEVKKLSEVAEISSGGTPNRKKKEYWNGKIPWSTTSEVKFNNIFGAKEYITEAGLQESSAKIFPKDTILIAMYGQGQTRGKSAVLKIEAATNQACAAIKVEEAYESQLIYQLLSYKYNELRSLSNDGSQKNLSLGLLSLFIVEIPSLKEEQRKIARFMNYLDQIIDKQDEKIEKLEQFKKGMMQKIFSQKLRFKDEDGEEFPEWEEKDFSILLESISTKPYQILSSQIVDDGKYEVVDQGKSLIAGYSNNAEKLFNRGSAIIYGDHTTVVKFREEPFVIGADGTKILINIKEENSLKYLYFALSFYNLEPEGYKRHFSILKNIKLPVPEPKEQEKIADYLTKLERKVEKEQEKLMFLEEQKKGFMWGMFV